jgi:hypothetical protein
MAPPDSFSSCSEVLTQGLDNSEYECLGDQP